MTLTIIISLIILGLVFILLEILVVPGTTIFGIIGFAMVVAGVWNTYTTFGNETGNYILLGTVLFSSLSLYFALKSKTWKNFMLNATIKGKVNTFNENLIHEGDTGVTISRIAPMGKVFINNNYFEVQVNAGFIDENTKIIVVKIDGNKIIVKKLK